MLLWCPLCCICILYFVLYLYFAFCDVFVGYFWLLAAADTSCGKQRPVDWWTDSGVGAASRALYFLIYFSIYYISLLCIWFWKYMIKTEIQISKIQIQLKIQIQMQIKWEIQKYLPFLLPPLIWSWREDRDTSTGFRQLSTSLIQGSRSQLSTLKSFSRS